MSTANFSANVTFAASANTFLQSQLSVTTQKTFTINQNRTFESVYIQSGSYETVYVSADDPGDVASTVYFYALSNAANTAPIDVYYVSASANVHISRLQPGEWMFFPYKSQANHPASSSIKLFNNSATGSIVSVIYGESGSL